MTEHDLGILKAKRAGDAAYGPEHMRRMINVAKGIILDQRKQTPYLSYRHIATDKAMDIQNGPYMEAWTKGVQSFIYSIAATELIIGN